ncbi:hypothetical protein TR70_5757 [Burkholderia pseudomallei]|uniref:AbiU2 domain-containing protein n=1 Tax=Burkholderia pseudomallei TaxID=28450 RepID=UPI0007068546|nr:hypothetical protein [Burkholderia pseudomallei]ALJ74833.1 hypothetical protein TR70_5757 [Burkholderia pseudomallei]
MSISNRIDNLRAKVKAAQEEFDMAVLFHEAWKPMAYDEGLHGRMGASYATHTFRTIRTALRREVLLALMRVWDYTPKSVQIGSVIEALGEQEVIDALVTERITALKERGGVGMDKFEVVFRESVESAVKDVTALFGQYAEGGSRRAVLDGLRKVRHEQLAHRQAKPSPAGGADSTDEEIESFYQDTSALIYNLLSIVLAVEYDPAETARAYSRPAELFWAGVRGERTEGHPSYGRDSLGA